MDTATSIDTSMIPAVESNDRREREAAHFAWLLVNHPELGEYAAACAAVVAGGSLAGTSVRFALDSVADNAKRFGTVGSGEATTYLAWLRSWGVSIAQ